MKPRLPRWIPVLVAVLGVASCADRVTTEPTIAAASTSTRSEGPGDAVVRILKRTESLPAMTASAVIGPRGGQIRIERAGVVIDFPKGALTRPTRITVTALGGANVAYTFQPHGIAFDEPVTIRQSLRGTTAWKTPLADQLQGSYFERLLVDPTESFARSLERRAGKLKDSRRFLEFSIEHFSGYMVSTGKSAEVDVDVSIDITSR